MVKNRQITKISLTDLKMAVQRIILPKLAITNRRLIKLFGTRLNQG